MTRKLNRPPSAELHDIVITARIRTQNPAYWANRLREEVKQSVHGLTDGEYVRSDIDVAA